MRTGIRAFFRAGFDSVVNAVSTYEKASNVYFEILPSRPRSAVFVGEDYFIRVGNSLVAATIVTEGDGGTWVRIIAGGGRESLLWGYDWGASGRYAKNILEWIEDSLGIPAERVEIVRKMEASKSRLLYPE